MDLTSYILVVGALLGVITAITQMIKGTWDINTKYMPWVSCGVGVIVAVAVKGFTVYSFYTMALIGFIAGLSACGLFDLTKFTKK